MLISGKRVYPIENKRKGKGLASKIIILLAEKGSSDCRRRSGTGGSEKSWEPARENAKPLGGMVKKKTLCRGGP